ncbi:MAG: hypothetical protein NVSMB18_29910 [Acetobacteraceae bacterium]
MKSILLNRVRACGAMLGLSSTGAKLRREKYERLSSERSIRYGRSARPLGTPRFGRARLGLAPAA